MLLRLLEIVRSLIHPPITTDPPRVFSVLGDIYQLCSSPKVGHISKKLLFYVAALHQLERQDWLRIEQDLAKEIDKLETELKTADAEAHSDEQRTNLLL